MKAIHVHEFGGPEVMKYEDAEDPLAGAGEVLIQVRAAGVNPVDTTFRSGAHPLSKSLKLPWTPGIDAAGEVIVLGEGVEEFQVGERVFGAATTGSYAEKAVLSVLQTARIPSNLSFEECASFPVVLYTAFYAVVIKAGIQPGQTLLVHAGAGGVGSMAIQIAKAAGARVITTVSSKEKGGVAESLGADIVVNYREEDFAERCIAESGGMGVDAVIEMVSAENFDGSCRALKRGGTMVLLGAGTGKSMVGSVTYPPFYSKDIDVRGMSLFNAGPVFPDMIRQVNHLLEQGKVRAIVGEEIPIAEAARAHEVLMTGKVAGKIILKV